MSRLTDQLVTAVTELEKIYQSRFVPAVVEKTDRLSALAQFLEQADILDVEATRLVLNLANQEDDDPVVALSWSNLMAIAQKNGIGVRSTPYREAAISGEFSAFISQYQKGIGETKTVVFVSATPYFLIYRVANALKKRGFKCYLIHLNGINHTLRSLFDSVMEGIAFVNGQYDVLATLLKVIRPELVHIQMWMLAYELCRVVREATPNSTIICEFYDVTSIYARREQLIRVWSEEVVDFDLLMEEYVVHNASAAISRYPADAMVRWAQSHGGGSITMESFQAYPSLENSRSRTGRASGSAPRRRLVYAGGLIPPYLPGELFPEAYMAATFKTLLDQGFEIDVVHDPHRAIDTNPMYVAYIQLSERYPTFRLLEGVPPDRLPAFLEPYDFGILLTNFPNRVEINPDQKAGVVATKIFAYLEAGLPILVNGEYLEMDRWAREYGVGTGILTSQMGRAAEIVDSMDYVRLANNVDRFVQENCMERRISEIEALYERAQEYQRGNLSTAVPDQTRDEQCRIAEYREALSMYLASLADRALWKGQQSQAVLCLSWSNDLVPNSAPLLEKAGDVFLLDGQVEKARESFEKASKFSPDDVGLARKCEHAAFLLGRRHAAARGPLTSSQNRSGGRHVKSLPLASSRRIRIGFVAGAGAGDALSFTFVPFLRSFDRNRFSVVAVCPSRIIKVIRSAAGDVAEQIPWYDTDALDPGALVSAVRGEALDIAIDGSVGNPIGVGELFERRIANVQAIWSPTEMASKPGDTAFILSDRTLSPVGSERGLGEMVIRHPRQCWSLSEYFLLGGADRSTAPQEPLVFGNRGDWDTLNEETLSRWSKILEEIPNSRLYLESNRPLRDQEINGLRHRVDRAKIDLGRVDGAIVEDYRETELVERCDIYLDTLPLSGGLVAASALAMGLPVVAQASRLAPNRVIAGLLEHLGMEECLASTSEEYEQAAIHLATSFDRGTRSRIRWRVITSDLHSSRSMTHEVEKIIEEVVPLARENCVRRFG